jgi:hypothetical protein
MTTERNVLMANRARSPVTRKIGSPVDRRLEEFVVSGIPTRLDPLDDRDRGRELRQGTQEILAQGAGHVLVEPGAPQDVLEFGKGVVRDEQLAAL